MILRPNDVRDRLVGVDLEDFAASESAQDRYLWENLATAHDRISRRLDIQIERVVVKVFPDSSLVLGVDYDVEEDAYDYDVPLWRANYGGLRLRRQPVISVEEVRLAWGADANDVFLTFPASWAQLHRIGGLLNERPDGHSSASIIISGVGAYYLPMLTGGWSRADFVPSIIAVDYTAGIVRTTTINDTGGISASDATMGVTSSSGFAATQYIRIGDEIMRISSITGTTWTIARGQRGTEARAHANGSDIVQWVDEHADIRRCIATQAALLTLGDKSEAGSDGKSSASVSADGLSQSTSFTKYRDTIEAMRADLADSLFMLEGKWHPMPMVVV